MQRGCEVLQATDMVTGDPVLRVIGEVDAATAPVFEDALLSVPTNRGRTLVVDLAQVGFMSAAGLRLLIDAKMRWEATGRSLRLRRPSPGVLMVLRAAGVEHLFSIEDCDGRSSAGR
jgi:anti-sigma B factor antagonist